MMVQEIKEVQEFLWFTIFYRINCMVRIDLNKLLDVVHSSSGPKKRQVQEGTKKSLRLRIGKRETDRGSRRKEQGHLSPVV